MAKNGDRIVIADALVSDVCAAAGISGHDIEQRFKGSALAGTVCSHPLDAHGDAGDSYAFDIPALEADFVEVGTGSGFVHIAPGHGADDWELGMKNGIAVPDTVGPDGAYLDGVGMFAGRFVMALGKI